MTTNGPADPRRTSRNRVLGGLLVGAGSAAAWAVHEVLDSVGTLTWAVVLGVAVANLGLLPARAAEAVRPWTRSGLRVGVALLGLGLSLGDIAGLGLPVLAVVATTLVATLVVTTAVGRRLGVLGPRGLLVATGTAICGASAIAGMEESAGAEEEDTAVAITTVTVFGTVAMLVLPLLRGPLGLDATQFGVWSGASIHEVGQVVAAASPAGSVALATAVVVKLTRVLMLAPVVGVVSSRRRLRSGPGRRPVLVPGFVLAFVVLVFLRTVGLVPHALVGPAATLQTLVLAGALFGMGTAVRLRSLVRTSGAAFVQAAVGTLVVTGVSLVGVLALVG